MLEIRLFEEKVQELFMQGLIEGTTHLCQGQEAVSVGAIAALRDDDYLTITYRGHGHALARGVSMEACFAELMGRATGCCKGVGGSMHFTDFVEGPDRRVRDRRRGPAGRARRRVVGEAAGHATASRSRSSATARRNIGTFHEALNMAAVWKAPSCSSIENNLYGEYTPLRDHDAARRPRRAGEGATAMPGVIVDGQDVDAVHAAVADAVARARAGDGPTLLEMKTYRYRGHSRTDPAKYRAEGELERWKERDPITLLGAKLAAEGGARPRRRRQRSATRSSSSSTPPPSGPQAPLPTLEEIRSYVYAG